MLSMFGVLKSCFCLLRLNATNALESTPLHTAACLPNFQKEIVELLLAEGGHMDMRNVQVGELGFRRNLFNMSVFFHYNHYGTRVDVYDALTGSET